MEKIDLLFEMVAKIAQEITELKSGQDKTAQEISEIKSVQNKTAHEISELREIIASNQQETNTRFDRMEQKLNMVIEQVAGLTEFKNETTLQINKLSAIVAEHSADIRLLKKICAG